MAYEMITFHRKKKREKNMKERKIRKNWVEWQIYLKRYHCQLHTVYQHWWRSVQRVRPRRDGYDGMIARLEMEDEFNDSLLRGLKKPSHSFVYIVCILYMSSYLAFMELCIVYTNSCLYMHKLHCSQVTVNARNKNDIRNTTIKIFVTKDIYIFCSMLFLIVLNSSIIDHFYPKTSIHGTIRGWPGTNAGH